MAEIPARSAACPVCSGATRPEPFFWDWRGIRRLRRCDTCTHQFVHPSITAADRDVIFSDRYFEAGGDIFDGAWGGGYEDEAENLAAEAREILALIPVPAGRILDLGCAGGIFLDVAARAGWDVTGVELNEQMAERARQRGAAVVQGSISDLPLDALDPPFDVVTLLDVLEHIPEPGEVMRRVAAWTRPGSILLIRGPLNNRRGARFREAIRRIVRADKRLDGYPLDANVFSKRSLEALVTRYGFRIRGWPGEAPGFANMVSVREGQGGAV